MERFVTIYETVIEELWYCNNR